MTVADEPKLVRLGSTVIDGVEYDVYQHGQFRIESEHLTQERKEALVADAMPAIVDLLDAYEKKQREAS